MKTFLNDAAGDGGEVRSLLERLGMVTPLPYPAIFTQLSREILLHPPLLDDFSLSSALAWYARGFNAPGA